MIFHIILSIYKKQQLIKTTDNFIENLQHTVIYMFYSMEEVLIA